MPNHTIATGTSAIAGIGRITVRNGLSSQRNGLVRPVSRPTDTPSTAPRPKPIAARESEARRSCSSVPLRYNSTAASHTLQGGGKMLSGNAPITAIADQTASTIRNDTSGPAARSRKPGQPETLSPPDKAAPAFVFHNQGISARW